MSYGGRRERDDSPDSVSDVWESVLLRPGMDRILESMSVRRRRVILLLLNEGTVETETDLIVRGSNDRDKTEIALRHIHLPKLAAAGYIEWNQDSGEISKGPRFDEIEPLLDLIKTHSDELPPDWP